MSSLLFIEAFAEGEHLDKFVKRSTLERGTIEGNSPVLKNHFTLLAVLLEYLGKRKSCGKQAGLTSQG